MNTAPPTPKGFRDILPDLAKKRRETINAIATALEEFGFVPIETPTIEFAETLTGKYGEEERLIYKFTDRGDRDLALRYDLTVPLARFVAANQNLISKEPFRRYQIGQVFRGENPQAGRYREFTQFDFDSIGSEDFEEEAMIIASAIKCSKKVGVSKAIMSINDRENFSQIPIEVIRAYDKIHKVNKEGVIAELKEKSFNQPDIEKYLEKLENSKPTKKLDNIFEILKTNYSLTPDHDFFFDPSLARGLDYYTGPIYELKTSPDLSSLSIGAGGRYDNLIGTFAKKQIPAVGFSFGIDRLVESIS